MCVCVCVCVCVACVLACVCVRACPLTRRAPLLLCNLFAAAAPNRKLHLLPLPGFGVRLLPLTQPFAILESALIIDALADAGNKTQDAVCD